MPCGQEYSRESVCTAPTVTGLVTQNLCEGIFYARKMCCASRHMIPVPVSLHLSALIVCNREVVSNEIDMYRNPCRCLYSFVFTDMISNS
jgi:hypothetical protein